jgi:hypothetical protein
VESPNSTVDTVPPVIKKSKTIAPDAELNTILNRNNITMLSKEELINSVPQPSNLLSSTRGGMKLKPIPDDQVEEVQQSDVDMKRTPFYFIGRLSQ